MKSLFCIKRNTGMFTQKAACLLLTQQERGGGFKHHLTLGTDPLNERFSGTGQKRLRGALPIQTSLQMLSVSAVSTVRVLLQQTHNV